MSELYYSDGSRVTFSRSSMFELANLKQNFEQFLRDKEHTYLQLEGFDTLTGKYVNKKRKVIYSVDEEYKKRILARLYKLEDWYQQLPPHRRYVAMLTLTTHQRGFDSYMEQYTFLSESWDKLRKVMRHDLGTFQYVLIGEPHKTGFLHFHILIFQNVRDDLIEKYKRVWSELYGAGSYEHGLKIDCSNKGCLRSAKNYLMKYISKTLVLHHDSEMLDGTDIVRFQGPGTNAHFVVYQAVKWWMNKHNNSYKGIRTFQPSRKLGQIMSLKYVPSDTVIWKRVTLVIWGRSYVIRESDAIFDFSDVEDL